MAIPPPLVPDPADLAPGDGKSAALDLARFRFHRVTRAEDSWFDAGYAALHAEFAPLAEIEERAVLEARLAARGTGMDYEMVVVEESGGAIAAVRDHTVITGGDGVVVHLSHSLVVPAWRRTGLAGWLRAIPVGSARRAGDRIVLVAEMEHESPATAGRLKAYGKAGFLKPDPARVPYLQPDFRSKAVIEADGGTLKPLPFSLVVRRVGREGERRVPGEELRAWVEALYAMFERDFGTGRLVPCREALAHFPTAGEWIDLLPPATP